MNQVGVGLSGSTGGGHFVGDNTPTLITPVIGAATGTSLVVSGNLTAGLGAGGSPGTLISFPTTTAKGRLVVAAVDNATGAFDTTISNATSVGQAQVVSIPDSGASTASFIVSATAGGQNINGGLTLGTPLVVGSGGLGISSVPTNGQIPIGNGTNYTAATITPGVGVSITNGVGTIQIDITGEGLAWSTLAGTSQAAAVNNGYISGAAGQTTVTLPATAAIGATIAVEGLGAGGWILAANTGQTIKIGSSTTSSAGSLTSAAASDNIYVTCIVASTTWRVRTTNSAGLTIA